ncbi:MAG TPA: N-acetylglucosamine-6-phosphate deacetylase [Micropepsaceae bacterium]|nr:N-acetylglucosamine-6-phosphate deacetylase [Micropepsaceae bacterium]
MTAPSSYAVAADFVFDGLSLRRDCAVIVEGERIRDLILARNLASDMPHTRLKRGMWLAPGFIDAQVNGGGDVLFNDQPTAEGIRAIVAAHRRSGTTSILPTLITDTDEKMHAAREAIAASKDPGVLGIHFEGPFLSPERAGVHDAKRMRAPEPHHLDLLTSIDGVTLVTLAPERVPRAFIRDLAKKGVRVALGHSMATYDETIAAIGDGLSGFTHLFNAMRPMSAREGGPIAAALESADVWYGLIVDGHHVSSPMLKLALKGEGHPMLVTDAMPPVNGSRASFDLFGQRIEVKDGRCVTQDGRLAGSAIDMATAVKNCVRLLGVPLIDALRLATLSPARFLGVDDRLGRLATDFRADMIAVDPGDVRVIDVWIAGHHQPS